jgi:hypothetical protein
MIDRGWSGLGTFVLFLDHYQGGVWGFSEVFLRLLLSLLASNGSAFVVCFHLDFPYAWIHCCFFSWKSGLGFHVRVM